MPPGRPTNQLYHGPAVDDDGALHHHVHVDDDEVASLTSRLRRTRAEMPVSPELVEIAAAWQQIDAQIEGIDFGRRIELLRYRDPLKNERESLSDRIERLQRRLEQEGSGFPLRRRQKLVEELEGELEATVTRLAQVEDRLASVQAAMAGLPDNREVQEMYGRRDQLDAQLRREADARVRGFPNLSSAVPRESARLVAGRGLVTRTLGTCGRQDRAPPPAVADHRPDQCAGGGDRRSADAAACRRPPR